MPFIAQYMPSAAAADFAPQNNKNRGIHYQFIAVVICYLLSICSFRLSLAGVFTKL